MYLSLTKHKYLFDIFLCIIFFLLNLFLPKLIFIKGFSIGFDFILVFLTILIFKYDNYKIIFLAFVFGLLQDFIISIEQIGIISFLKSISVYCVGLIKQYQFIWNSTTKYLTLLLISFFHFFIYYFLIFNEFNFFIIYSSIFNSFLYFISILIINKYYFNSRLI